MVSVSWAAVRGRRLARHSLLERGTDLVDVAGATCGIHAQVQAAAELALSARVADTTKETVRGALWRHRTLVKAWTLRGTLHLHPADELPLWFAARRAVGAERKGLAAWPDPHGVLHPAVTPDEQAELEAAALDAFTGEPLLRAQLVDEVVRRVGTKHEGRLRSGFAFFLSELCQGPPQGNKITLVRPDQWLRAWRGVDNAAALREVLRRFLHTYGPSRPDEFRPWFGADVSFGDLDLTEIDVEGHRAFVLAGDAEFDEPAGSLHLLPEYDVYVMGFREREHLVPDDVRALVAAHKRGKYEGPAAVRFLMVDGVARGIWERKKRGKKIDIAVTPTVKLTRVQRALLDEEVERIGACVGAEPLLRGG